MKTTNFALVILGLLAAPSAWAAPTYKIALEARVNDDKPLQGTVITQEGVTGRYTSPDSSMTVKVTPFAQGPGVVKIQTEFLKLEKGYETKSLGSPSVIVKLGQEAIVSERNIETRDKIRVKLKPTLQ